MQGIQIRGPDHRIAMGVDLAVSLVVSHDQDDVRPPGGLARLPGRLGLVGLPGFNGAAPTDDQNEETQRGEMMESHYFSMSNEVALVAAWIPEPS